MTLINRYYLTDGVILVAMFNYVNIVRHDTKSIQIGIRKMVIMVRLACRFVFSL